jgi:hypothetical protein
LTAQASGDFGTPGTINDDCGAITIIDLDGDGYEASASGGTDCNDNDANKPRKDFDCDGVLDVGNGSVWQNEWLPSSNLRYKDFIAKDMDGDGDLDVLYASSQDDTIAWFENHGGPVAARPLNGSRFGPQRVITTKANGPTSVCAMDLDGDGDEEILVTNLEAQSNSCYRNDGNGMFMETSFANGLGPASLPHVGFGIQAFDANLDGHLDIFVTNGHIIESIGEIRQGASHFAQPDQLFLGDGNGFKLAPYSAQVDPTVGRSLLRGDLDNDGDDDLIITRWNSNPQLLRSTAAGSAAVLGLRLEGSSDQSNRDAIGARITVSAGGREWMREHRVQSSYLASHDPRLLFALPEGCTEGDVSVLWPDGKVETRRLEAGSYHHWIQGQESLVSTEFSPPR